MSNQARDVIYGSLVPIVKAEGEDPIFAPGDQIRIATKQPVGHYRVPAYVRGKLGVIEAIMKPRALNNEEEGFGRNAGSLLHYYRVAINMRHLWSDYQGAPRDSLRIEVFETWLQGVAT